MSRQEADHAIPPLAGRQVELAAARQTMAKARQERQMHVVEVVGEPGMGKTRLLAEIASRARDEDWSVVLGQPAELGPPLPLAPLVDALDDHLNDADLGALELAEPGSVDLLATVFPAIGKAGAGPDARLIQDYRLLRALRALLCLLAEANGLVLVLDNVHRSDPLTVTVLDYLLRHPPQAPLLLALAYRPRRASPRLLRPLIAAAHDGTARRIVLSPLTAEEAETLLDPRMRRWQRDLTYRRSGGNPTYLEILTAAGTLAEQAPGRGPTDELPPLVTAPLLADFEELSPRARLISHAAAVIGDRFDPQLLADVAEVGHADVLCGIDEMLQNDIICSIGASQQFQFRHPLLRQVAYEQASGGWRLGAHRRAATALGQRQAPPAAIAAHIERAATPGDADSTRVLIDAARSVLRTDPGQAADWLNAALHLLGEHAGVRQSRLEILDLLSAALTASGRLQQARQVLAELLAAPESPNRAAALLRATDVDLLLARVPAARRRLRAELASPGRSCLASTALWLGLGVVSLHEDRPELAVVEQAAQTVADDALPATRALAAAALAAARIATGTPGAGESADLAADLIDGSRGVELTSHLWALICLADAEIDLQRYNLAREHANRGIAIARRTGNLHLLPYLLASCAESHRRRGELAAAASVTDQLEVIVDGAGQPPSLSGMLLLLQARNAIDAGESATAVSIARRAIDLVGPLDGRLARMSRICLGHALIGDGQWEYGAQTMLDAGGGRDLPALRPCDRLAVCTDLVRAELARGHLQAARHWLDRAHALADPDLPGHTARTQLAGARLLLGDDPEQAAERARCAADLFMKTGERVDVGRALLVSATALDLLGNGRAAQDTRAEAVLLLAECGARRLIDALDEEHRTVVEQSAHAIEAAPDPPASTAPAARTVEFAALSEREMQIAQLVSHGHTNRQIARLLSLSHKTVETYLARIFTKLGVGSRASVATLVGCGALGARNGERAGGDTCVDERCTNLAVP